MKFCLGRIMVLIYVFMHDYHLKDLCCDLYFKTCRRQNLYY